MEANMKKLNEAQRSALKKIYQRTVDEERRSQAWEGWVYIGGIGVRYPTAQILEKAGLVEYRVQAYDARARFGLFGSCGYKTVHCSEVSVKLTPAGRELAQTIAD
jgi:hypothetical protein